ncbi:hypothetical protein V2J09_015746 [Rumex salicifolius]
MSALRLNHHPTRRP